MRAGLLATTAMFAAGLFVVSPATHDRDDLVVVQETDLVADAPDLVDYNGILHSALILDPHLVNPWGIAESASSPFWMANNNGGTSTLYSVPASGPIHMLPLVVSMPGPGDPLARSGKPTGAVFNTDVGGQGFKISGLDTNGNPTVRPALFLFATEDGTIIGWNPAVNPPGFDPLQAGTYGIIAVDNSANPSPANGAVYKGLAIATDAAGRTLLYATNFRAGTIDVYDDSFQPVTDLPSTAFTDPHLPHGYAPFNVVPVGGRLFVTYARQDSTKHDDVAGPAHGIVDTYDFSGNRLARFAQHARLNSPWGVVQAPASFGDFAGAILIGNFGDGRIHAYDSTTGDRIGTVTNSIGQEILIDGLWTLMVGNGGNGGAANAVYFTAGPNAETHGLFGSLVPVALGTPCGVPCR